MVVVGASVGVVAAGFELVVTTTGDAVDGTVASGRALVSGAQLAMARHAAIVSRRMSLGPDEALLHHVDGEIAVAGVDRAGGKSAGA